MLQDCTTYIRVILVFILVVSASVSDIYSQQRTTLHGVVSDESSGELLPGADVSVMLTTEEKDTLVASANTSDDGEFIVKLEEGISYQVYVEHPEYMRNRFEWSSVDDRELQVSLSKSYSIYVAGHVVNGITGNRVESAQIEIQPVSENVETEYNVGTTTDENGEFRFGFNYSLPFRMRVTHVSYFSGEQIISNHDQTDVSITISPRVFEEEDVIVTADMVTSEEMEQTKTIGKVTSVDVQQLSSFDAFDLISTIREVDVATQSMNMQTINTRGFNSGANSGVLQLTDGVDNQAPGLGFPIGNLLGPSDLDIAGMEMELGPSSSINGPNAMNGVLNISSKNPFDSPGFSMQMKGGVNDLKLGGESQFAAEGDRMTEVNSRFAHVLHSRFAVKFTAGWLTGKDWRANNYDNIGSGESWQSYRDVHGYSGVNVYGDESKIYLPLGVDEDGVLDGTIVPVTRDGYREEDLADYDIETRKAAGSLHFRPFDNTEIVLGGRYGYTNTLYTDDSRIRLEDFEIFQYSAEITAPGFFLRGYRTNQNSGNSYDIMYMASQLQNSSKSDEDWFRDYRIAFESGVPVRGIPANDLTAARNFANSGVTLLDGKEARSMLEPGTEEFQSEFNRLRSVYDFEDGAGIKDNSSLIHIESAYTRNDLISNLELTAGGSFRFYDLESEGTIFPDTTGNEITNYEYGGYLQAKTRLLSDRLNLNGAIRVDVNENFHPALSPQIGANYNIKKETHVRASYQYGFRFPSVREQFMNQRIGNGRILGGLRKNYERYELIGNAVTELSVDRFNEVVIAELNRASGDPEKSLTRVQSEQMHLDVLESGILPANALKGIKPEQAHAFEIGYSQLFSSDLFIDLNYFVTLYDDFIGLTRVIKPRTSPSVDLVAAAGQVNNALQSDRYYYYNNAQKQVTVHGLSFDFKQQASTFFFGVNGTLTQMLKNADDPLIPGFNTPPVKMNLEWGNRQIAPNVGFKMVYRYRSGYDWNSPFLDGRVDEYGHFDFQLNVGISELNSMIKAGFTNMGIQRYTNIFGGPAIGTIVFATFTYNPGIF